jgi:hypothetical protein
MYTKATSMRPVASFEEGRQIKDAEEHNREFIKCFMKK